MLAALTLLQGCAVIKRPSPVFTSMLCTLVLTNL